MPEICEVVMTSHYLLSKLKNKEITGVQVLSGRYMRTKIEGVELLENNFPLKIVDINTKGKFLWFELYSEKHNKSIYIMNTFGMSGGWNFEVSTNNRVQLTIKDNDKSYKLYFFDQRNFGTIKIIDNRNKLDKKLKELGDDLLKTEFTDEEFLTKIEKYNKKKGDTLLYKVLMDQTQKGIGSGLGNYLTPEVLYRAKIAPHRKINSLSKDEIKKLSQSIKYILKLCYYNNKEGYMEIFGDYINKHKQGIENGTYPNYHENIDVNNKKFQFQVYGQETDPKGNTVRRDKSDLDRTIHWVPAVQK
jgi:formamidopyrimidine-DNA glycosylase